MKKASIPFPEIHKNGATAPTIARPRQTNPQKFKLMCKRVQQPNGHERQQLGNVKWSDTANGKHHSLGLEDAAAAKGAKSEKSVEGGNWIPNVFSHHLIPSKAFPNCFKCWRFMTRSRGTPTQEIDSEPERTLRQRLKENQNQSNPKVQVEMEHMEGTHDDQTLRPRRTMVDFVTQSPNTNKTSIITPSIQANNFDFKPQLLLMLQTHYQFNGLANEDPNDHLERFLDLCATFKYNGVSDDAARLRLFKFTLGGRAKTWLNTLPAGSIATWEDLQKKFLGKYFPPAKTIKLRNKIFQFLQESEEHLSEAWERLNGLLKRCPNHKIELWSQIEIFYNGLSINTRSMIDAAAGGSINKKTPEEVYELIEEMADNMYSYPMERSVKKPAGIYKLDSSTATQAQLEALQRQFANF
ncbi:hypothetical protein H6P81_002793 [Aristolochia fimbriata]|uniref:Retrotransposon gag domain-containing protein n=1 Tax=Aristolochia fimbriata TaxID=158543 RepID=A0AAV7FAR5_ARIFI|nr:hypothetical protein H6P81_002793 [Aristolochia fimbriata]